MKLTLCEAISPIRTSIVPLDNFVCEKTNDDEQKRSDCSIIDFEVIDVSPLACGIE